MVANFITTDNWVVDEQLTVAEMVDKILVGFEELDPSRKYMFIKWLRAHAGKVNNAVNVGEGLTAWFESMQHENIQWEYRLIMGEIGWWDRLDDQSLAKIMLADLARSNA